MKSLQSNRAELDYKLPVITVIILQGSDHYIWIMGSTQDRQGKRIDKGKEWYLTLFVNGSLSSHRYCTRKPSHVQTTSKKVSVL